MHEARALRQRSHSGLLDARAGPGAKAANSSPKDSSQDGSEDTEMHEARVLKQRSHSRPADTSRRNGMTPEQFAPFIFRGNSRKLPPSPTRAGRPAANVLKASRSRSFPRGERIQQFKLKVNNKYQRLEREATVAGEYDGDAQWNFNSHGLKTPPFSQPWQDCSSRRWP